MTLLLVQMTVVLLVTVFCGWLARKLGQARVIGEIIGGILIGPSVFGRFTPHWSATLFPPSSFNAFDILSTVGLILFLFLIGMELDYGQLYKQRATAVMASGMSIVFPFAMGALLAHSLRIRFAPHGIGSIPFVLFLGISMSITAFPVLARIIEERRMQGTALGTTAIMCAAVDDVVAWTLLAIALALIGHDGGSASLSLRIGSLGRLFVPDDCCRPTARGLAGKTYAHNHRPSARNAGSRCGPHTMLCRSDGSDWRPPAVWGIYGRRMFPQGGAVADCNAHETGYAGFCAVASALFCTDGHAHTTRPAEWKQRVVLGRDCVDCRRLRENGRSRAGCEMEWSIMERCCRIRSVC